MKVEELMIGDWIIDGKNITRITSITCDGIIETTFNKSSNIEVIKPIHLTPEILEKNGFEDIGGDTYRLEEKPYWFWVDFFNNQYGCEYDTPTHEYEDDEHRLKLYGIPSVQELQHALRLCGIDKTIEL
jgi:hypothetical protein